MCKLERVFIEGGKGRGRRREGGREGGRREGRREEGGREERGEEGGIRLFKSYSSPSVCW